MIAIDTNLLVYSHRALVPEHRAAQAALENAASRPLGWGVSLPCLTEFWLVATHPSSTGRPSTPHEARSFLMTLCDDGGMQVFHPTRNLGVRLLKLAESMGIVGARVFDLQIGLIAMEAGATELWTHDLHFRAPSGLRVMYPLVETPE